MEYTLLLENKKIYITFILGFISFVLFIAYAVSNYGLYAFILTCGFLVSLIITPLVCGRFKFLLYLWLLVVPLFDNVGLLSIKGTNIFVFIATALSGPFALLLLYKSTHKVVKELPFVVPLLLFELVIFINFLRPGTYLSNIAELIKHFIEIFIVFCVYFYFKNQKNQDNQSLTYNLFKFLNIFVMLNSAVAIFQSVTGIGMGIISGVPRPLGLLGGPNSIALLINLLLPVAIYYLFIEKAPAKDRKFWLISSFINIFGLLVTLSKTSYVIFFIMLFIFSFLMSFKIKIRLLYGFICFFVLGAAAIIFLDLDVLTHLSERMTSVGSLEWRLKVWNLLLYNFDFNTFIIGNGIHSAKYYLLRINFGEDPHVHNIYIQYAYEYGIAGILYCLNIVFLAVTFMKAMFCKKYANSKVYIIPFIIALSMLISMFNSNALAMRTSLYFAWTLLTVYYLQLNSDKLKILEQQDKE